MNERFVNIKVDREERPDIDHLYMSALHALGEQGGWPLTMFIAPDGAPFWGGTYFPPEPRWGRPSFRQVLQGVSEAYRADDEMVTNNAAALRQALDPDVRRQPGRSARRRCIWMRWPPRCCGRPIPSMAGCRARRNSPTRRSSGSCGRTRSAPARPRARRRCT